MPFVNSLSIDTATFLSVLDNSCQPKQKNQQQIITHIFRCLIIIFSVRFISYQTKESYRVQCASLRLLTLFVWGRANRHLIY